MNTGIARAIFEQLDNEHYSENEKAIAIYEVMNMETHNSVRKDDMLKAIKYLWHKLYVFKEGEKE